MDAYERLYGRSLEVAVEDTLQRGYALMPTNVLPYVSGVAVTVPCRTGSPHTALSVSALSNRIMEDDRYARIVSLLQTEADAIATALQAGPDPARRAAATTSA